ncbi:hypothetical protein BJX62DRAFT_240110 [Aspergillus germanicus]
MKLRTALISMLMLALSSALIVPAPRAAEGEGNPVAECGALGVMTFDPADLPEGVLPSDVRKCRDHPLGRNRHDKDASLAPLDAVRVDSSFYNGTDSDTDRGTSPVGGSSDLDLDTSDDKQACYYDAPYGLRDSYVCVFERARSVIWVRLLGSGQARPDGTAMRHAEYGL